MLTLDLIQGDIGMKGSFATRVSGSADLYRVSLTDFMLMKLSLSCYLCLQKS